MTLAESFEKKIKNKELPRPIPRWRICTKRCVLRTAFALVSLVSIISLSVFIWFVLDPNGFSSQAEESWSLAVLLDVLPLFWGGLGLVAAVVALVFFIKLPRGYRFKTPLILGSLVVVFFLAGGSVCALGMAGHVENLARSFPAYESLSNSRFMKMMQPAAGTIIGQVKELRGNELILADPSGLLWRVDILHVDRLLLNSGVKQGGCARFAGSASSSAEFFDASATTACPRGTNFSY